MSYMSEKDLLEAAIRELPALLKERLQKTTGRVVRCDIPARGLPGPTLSGNGDDAGDKLLSEIARMLEIELEPSASGDSADVEYVEQTALGTRKTVVQIRNGRVARVIAQG